MPGKKCPALVVLVLFAFCVSPALGDAPFSGWTPSIEARAGAYGAIAIASYLDDGLPMRTQGIVKLCVDPLAFTVGRVRVGGAVVVSMATPSLIYNQTRLKGFWGYGSQFSLSFAVTEAYRLALEVEYERCHSGTDIEFASVGASLSNELRLGGGRRFEAFLTAPLEFSYRKDLAAVSLSVGMRLVFKAPWIAGMLLL